MPTDNKLKNALASDLTDTVGAADLLTKRLGRNISVDTVHNLVREGRLHAYVFQDGELVPRPMDRPTRGKDLLFLKADLYAMTPPPGPGNPTFKSDNPGKHKNRKV